MLLYSLSLETPYVREPRYDYDDDDGGGGDDDEHYNDDEVVMMRW